jgi:hypothetical protein
MLSFTERPFATMPIPNLPYHLMHLNRLQQVLLPPKHLNRLQQVLLPPKHLNRLQQALLSLNQQGLVQFVILLALASAQFFVSNANYKESTIPNAKPLVPFHGSQTAPIFARISFKALAFATTPTPLLRCQPNHLHQFLLAIA